MVPHCSNSMRSARMSAHETDSVRRIFGELGIGEQPAQRRTKDLDMTTTTTSDAGILAFPGKPPARKRRFEPRPGDPAWRETRADGSPVASMHNARLAITALGVACSYDAF